MSLLQYFGWVRRLLFAALLAANWCVPIAAAPRWQRLRQFSTAPFRPPGRGAEASPI
jgi:hypothetical protein